MLVLIKDKIAAVKSINYMLQIAQAALKIRNLMSDKIDQSDAGEVSRENEIFDKAVICSDNIKKYKKNSHDTYQRKKAKTVCENVAAENGITLPKTKRERSDARGCVGEMFIGDSDTNTTTSEDSINFVSTDSSVSTYATSRDNRLPKVTKVRRIKDNHNINQNSDNKLKSSRQYSHHRVVNKSNDKDNILYPSGRGQKQYLATFAGPQPEAHGKTCFRFDS